MENKNKLDKIKEKINQLKAQKQAILAKEREKERKARTRNLIQIGAIIENIGITTPELAAEFKSYLETNKEANILLKKFLESI
ncbi:hypothetical protein FDF15_17955 [Clostridium botulinum]|uniref:hypothetical protein n=1 Tax=Clostridium botulinum TaxID=1491 RepID=UPI0013F1315B|nr:hypothetical protein [Clostridium botulinum]MBY6998997.1 hypothetical protein [Clostridium botulinum]MBY7013051.1 hypothetical protein [Clostridium botulinum]MCR1156640.1 hypothetical protein [Clostridium botulinum]MCS6168285.1 hypothetical protein [Clostridium botulinum]NEZ97887.1 hypothetical protein [Clostridium botulinum]